MGIFLALPDATKIYCFREYLVYVGFGRYLYCFVAY